jgi:hypothetical protein
VVKTPTTRGRAASSDKYLSTSEKKAVKNIFDKQVITLTYIGSIKDPAKKVETACILIIDNFKTRQGPIQIRQYDSSGSLSEKYKCLKRFIAKLFTEISKSPPSVQSSLDKVEPSAVEEEKSEENHSEKAIETVSQEDSDVGSDKSTSFVLPSTKQVAQLGGGLDKRKFLLDTKPERAPIARGKAGFQNNFYKKAAISRAKEEQIKSLYKRKNPARVAKFIKGKFI